MTGRGEMSGVEVTDFVRGVVESIIFLLGVQSSRYDRMSCVKPIAWGDAKGTKLGRDMASEGFGIS